MASAMAGANPSSDAAVEAAVVPVRESRVEGGTGVLSTMSARSALNSESILETVPSRASSLDVGSDEGLMDALRLSISEVILETSSERLSRRIP